MSIDTIIDELTEELERPDLYSISETFIPACIREAHAIRRWTKDLAFSVVPDPEVDEDNRVRLSRVSEFPGMRDITQVKLYAGYTEPVTGTYLPFNEIPLSGEGFKNRNEMNDIKDYYGIRYQHLYSIVGTELLLQGVDSSTKAIEFKMLFWPTITRSQVDNKLTTTSWIVEEAPEVVKAYLRQKLAGVIQKERLIQTAQGTTRILREDLINSNEGEWY